MQGNKSIECEGEKKPLIQMTCNTDPCPTWNFGGWGQVYITILMHYVMTNLTIFTNHVKTKYFGFKTHISMDITK